MWNYRRYLLPFIVITALILEYSGILHIAYIHIRSHELKWTELALNYHPKEGDLFTAGEIVSQNNYEDALLAINPDYNQMLQEDLNEIAQNRERIDYIDHEDLSFYSGPYKIKACLDQKMIQIKDTTLFRKIIEIEILGNLELYSLSDGNILYTQSHRKFWIRDQITIRGRSRQAFILNKVDEIWLAQMSNNAHKIVDEFEQPYEITNNGSSGRTDWPVALSRVTNSINKPLEDADRDRSGK